MKSLTLVMTMALILATTGMGFAGNRPAVTYPEGALVTSNPSVQMAEVTPWHKGAVKYASGVVGSGVWYRNCPVMTNVLLNSKHEYEVTLSNGKKIMLSSPGLKEVVEADLKKYEPYMYGGSNPTASPSEAQNNTKLERQASLN
jgi:hypothetical protein